MKKLLSTLCCLFVVVSFNSCVNDDSTGDPVVPPGPEPDKVVNIKTFDKEHLGFGGGLEQTAVKTFTFPTDMDKVKNIKLYLQLACPTAGCNIWDMYANVQAKDKTTGKWYEIARYITPYGRSTEVLERGLVVDVTDFKSVLQGATELRIFIEVWGADGWLVSTDFDYTYGTPDYKYYEVEEVMAYNKNSLEGVPYGETHNFDLTHSIQIPTNAESAHIRTIISGWGHATPMEAGRGCAEWCYRTHHVWINSEEKFSHELKAEGCASNPINNQRGNWKPDRAGWCPGMMVPVRIDKFTNSVAGQNLNFEYKFQPWTNDMQAQIDNPHAYYAISNYIVVKSNSPIVKPIVN
ncbi:peptide-N-glycosidase F-related protein [Myroides ceti]|uniref:Peptide-N-glycosidase F-related protein n=1 Tax=Paenimyroides ceti TaxID=395087 RepID=A0ABT8CQE3_9FLAO|nr:peptide-N-glycosidase F-related protein [Paenimyroides ceti]MDN3706738.1 peptide-N-glycosidase F-related protein [Paenimyroides ceti]